MTQPAKLARNGNIAKQLSAKPRSGRFITTTGDSIQTEDGKRDLGQTL
jgi:hypothetical protein